MLSFLRSLRHLPRYRRIAAVLTRHGLGWLADQLGLSRFFSWPRRLLRRDLPLRPVSSLAQRLCRALEELGPSFVLLGHYLRTRPDLFPLSLCRELECLPAAGPAMPAAEVTRSLEQEWGRPWTDLLSEIDPLPCRRTWLEQVHRARTVDGDEVWVAVPNVAVLAQWEEDQPLFQDIAQQVDEHRPFGWCGSAVALWQDWREEVRQETDGAGRGRHAERWQDHWAGQEGVAVPEVDWTRTTARVLTCRSRPARSWREVAADDPQARRCLARTLYRFYAQAIFCHGFYPAPAALEGLAVLADGRLLLTALAPVGHLGPAGREAIWDLLERFRDEDQAGMVDECAALGLFGQQELSAARLQALRHLVERYRGLPCQEISLSELAGEIFALAARGVLALPSEIGLLLRTLVAVEEVGRRLAPEVIAAEEMAPFVQQAMARQHSWSARGQRVARAGQTWLEALRSFPAEARRLLVQAVQGALRLGVEPRGWQRVMRRLERMVARLVLSMVAAGLLMGLALLVSVLLPAPGGVGGWVLAGVAMAVLAGLGFLLLLAFLRRGYR